MVCPLETNKKYSEIFTNDALNVSECLQTVLHPSSMHPKNEMDYLSDWSNYT